MKQLIAIGLLLVCGYFLLGFNENSTPNQPTPAPCPGPEPCPVPDPTPPPAPSPPKKPAPRPWGPRSGCRSGSEAFVQLIEDAKVGGNLAPDGTTEIQCDLPTKFHIKNRGGSDGAGLCVFASLSHASIWQHVRQTDGIFQWMFKYPGGGYPQKVDKKIEEICKEKGVPTPDYVQIESKDLEPLKVACKSRRMVCCTYSYSPTGRYNGQKISHMVNAAHCDDKWVGILDNNFPGTIEWMDPTTFMRTYTGGSGNGWSVIFLNGPPPVAPKNKG